MKKIGLVGYGNIGRLIARNISSIKEIDLTFVFDPYVEKLDIESMLLDDLSDQDIKGVDLMVETANHKVLREYGPKILRHTN